MKDYYSNSEAYKNRLYDILLKLLPITLCASIYANRPHTIFSFAAVGVMICWAIFDNESEARRTKVTSRKSCAPVLSFSVIFCIVALYYLLIIK